MGDGYQPDRLAKTEPAKGEEIPEPQRHRRHPERQDGQPAGDPTQPTAGGRGPRRQYADHNGDTGSHHSEPERLGQSTALRKPAS